MKIALDMQTQEMPGPDTPYFSLWSDSSNMIHVLATFSHVPGKLQSKPLVYLAPKSLHWLSNPLFLCMNKKRLFSGHATYGFHIVP